MNICALLLIAEVSIKGQDRAILYLASLDVFSECHEGFRSFTSYECLQLLDSLFIGHHQVILHYLIFSLYFLKFINYRLRKSFPKVGPTPFVLILHLGSKPDDFAILIDFIDDEVRVPMLDCAVDQRLVIGLRQVLLDANLFLAKVSSTRLLTSFFFLFDFLLCVLHQNK